MTILTVPRLNRFMNSPEWTEDQKLAAQDVIAGVESRLEDGLYGAYITPRTMVEVAPILRSGLVATRQVVHSVGVVDGVTVDEDHPLALPWILSEHRLRRIGSPQPVSYPSFGVTPSSWGGDTVPYTDAVGQVELVYQGGWNDDPGIVLALLNKSQSIMLNRFDDSIRARNMDAERSQVVFSEEWTEDELKSLGTYRNLTARR
jgi:hypothetical protein